MPDANKIIQGLEAYARYNGIGDVVLNSGGIVSLTRVGAGTYVVILNSALVDTDMLCVVTPITPARSISVFSQSDLEKRILVFDSAGGAEEAELHIAFYRVYIPN